MDWPRLSWLSHNVSENGIGTNQQPRANAPVLPFCLCIGWALCHPPWSGIQFLGHKTSIKVGTDIGVYNRPNNPRQYPARRVRKSCIISAGIRARFNAIP